MQALKSVVTGRWLDRDCFSEGKHFNLLATSCLIAISRWAETAIDLCSLNSVREPRTNLHVTM